MLPGQCLSGDVNSVMFLKWQMPRVSGAIEILMCKNDIMAAITMLSDFNKGARTQVEASLTLCDQ